MAKRSYKQHCALAKALDLVGERWTLLLIRELLTGPKRYKELLEGMPNMGTNLLAARLRDLAAADLVEQDDVHYRLTPRGAALEESVLALARWGSSELAQPDPEDLWLARWNVVAFKYAFQPDKAGSLKGVFEYRVDGERMQARIHDGTIETSAACPWKADVTVETSGEVLLAIARGELDVKEAEAGGELALAGNRRLFRSSLKAFPPMKSPA